jgi:hypothetical protein
MPTSESVPIHVVVDAARRRLGWVEVRRSIVSSAPLVLGCAAACAMARPIVWPLEDGVLWRGVARAIVLGTGGVIVGCVVVAVRAWRQRPSLLGAARSVDRALGLAEVIASGFAFERDAREDEMAAFAVAKARRSLDGVDIDQLLTMPRVERASRRRLVLAASLVVLGLFVGAMDRVIVGRAIHPVTAREAAAASTLEKAAIAAAAAQPERKPDPKPETVLEAARRASEAAKRGDRRSANEALEDMRKAARALESDDREHARALRTLRDELEGTASAAKGSAGAGKENRPGRPSMSASEALARLEREIGAASPAEKEEMRKLAERLEKAEAAARAAAASAHAAAASAKPGESNNASSAAARQKEAAWSRAAAALAEARAAAARGDTEAARRAMQRAEEAISELEKQSADPARASAMSRLADGASELDRSMFAATSREKSGSPMAGTGPSEGGRDGSGENGKTPGRSDPSGMPGGTGGGTEKGDRAAGADPRRVKVQGDLQARTDVRAGERAVSAIDGMGRGGDPRAYREIFPSYDTVVEDGLREDTVPAARRPTVRRYFSSIRPGGDDDESRK